MARFDRLLVGGLLDAEGRLVTWNVGAERITGYTADEIIGKHFSMFYTQEDVARGVPDMALKANELSFFDLPQCAATVGAREARWRPEC